MKNIQNCAEKKYSNYASVLGMTSDDAAPNSGDFGKWGVTSSLSLLPGLLCGNNC